MRKEERKQHESYGMISISKFQGNGAQFFGSDLIQNGGVSITISQADVLVDGHRRTPMSGNVVTRLRMSYNQFVDAITSGMNTSGVPCTLEYVDGKRVEQTTHVEDKKDLFAADMADTQRQYLEKIDAIMEKLEGNIGKRKAQEIKHDLGVLHSHVSSNTPYVMGCFREAMEDTVTEAKHSIAGYVEHKIRSAGLESLRGDATIKIENE